MAGKRNGEANSQSSQLKLQNEESRRQRKCKFAFATRWNLLQENLEKDEKKVPIVNKNKKSFAIVNRYDVVVLTRKVQLMKVKSAYEPSGPSGRRGTMRVKYLAQEHNTVLRSGLEPGPPKGLTARSGVQRTNH